MESVPPKDISAGQNKSAAATNHAPIGTVSNLAEPLKLEGLNWDGFAASSGMPGQTVSVISRASLTSDQPEFHLLVGSTSELLASAAKKSGIHINPTRHSDVLLIIHADKSADLYLDTAAVGIKSLAKRDLKAGQVVFQRDVADILWPAPGSEDTKFGVTMGPEVGHGEAEVYARVQA